MKSAIMVAGCAVVMGVCGGCMSPGGLVVGPLSYMSAKSNEANLRDRAVMASSIPAEKKPQVIMAMRSGVGDEVIATGIGVDILAFSRELRAGRLTGGEVGKQLFFAAGDVAIEAYLGDKLLDALDGDDPEPVKPEPSFSISGSGNTIIVQNTASVDVNNSRNQ